MKIKVYQKLARSIDAYTRCFKSSNAYSEQYLARIKDMLDNDFPHGSGLDDKWAIDLKKSSSNRIILYSSYHAMDENGYYDCWIYFTLTIKPDLANDIDMKITGKFGNKYEDIKDNLYQIMDVFLNELVNEY